MAKTTTLKQAKRDEESKVIKDIYGVIQYESIYPQTLTDVVFTSEGDNLTDELTRIENLIPDSFETLTIKETGKDDIIYDGSVAKEITLSSGGGEIKSITMAELNNVYPSPDKVGYFILDYLYDKDEDGVNVNYKLLVNIRNDNDTNEEVKSYTQTIYGVQFENGKLTPSPTIHSIGTDLTLCVSRAHTNIFNQTAIIWQNWSNRSLKVNGLQLSLYTPLTLNSDNINGKEDTEEQAVKTLQYLLDNKATKDYVDNSIPTELPNPNTLTIKQDGEDDIVYDGSAAKEITLSSGGGDVNLSNYLAKDNETEYTPTEDYNPSTKKYIDDAIQTAIGDVLGGDY